MGVYLSFQAVWHLDAGKFSGRYPKGKLVRQLDLFRFHCSETHPS